MTIRNPVGWTADLFRLNASPDRPRRANEQFAGPALDVRPIHIRTIALQNLRTALSKGYEDFGANRMDVVFICLFYPIFGLVTARLASGINMLPLVFPLASGFALFGPLAGVGLYELSRRREQGLPTRWTDAFRVVGSPSFGSMFLLGLLLFGLYAAWLLTAWGIYAVTLGPQPPVSVSAFVHDVFTTRAGLTMAVAGIAAGFVYACIVLLLTVVAFPMLLDRNVGVRRAIATSVQVVRASPGPIAVWGLLVTLGLMLGSLPLFLGLVIVFPVLGHATWHLYRMTVAE